MKKILCLFVREFTPRGKGMLATLTREVTPGLEGVLVRGAATVKYDGTACMVRNGQLFKRYDVKKGRTVPPGTIPCEEKQDPVTGHWPHWVAVGPESDSKWYRAAWEREGPLVGGTYELCGPHFQGNPQNFSCDTFIRHGEHPLLDVPRYYDGLRTYLEEATGYEGIVFWLDGEPRCKIRRADFGFPWPIKATATPESA